MFALMLFVERTLFLLSLPLENILEAVYRKTSKRKQTRPTFGQQAEVVHQLQHGESAAEIVCPIFGVAQFLKTS